MSPGWNDSERAKEGECGGPWSARANSSRDTNTELKHVPWSGYQGSGAVRSFRALRKQGQEGLVAENQTNIQTLLWPGKEQGPSDCEGVSMAGPSLCQAV